VLGKQAPRRGASVYMRDRWRKCLMPGRLPIALILAALLAPAAHAQPAQPAPPDAVPLPRCAPLNEYRQRLEHDHHQALIGFGVRGDGRLLQLYVSGDGSWTMLVTHPGGWTCVVSIGIDWAVLPVGEPS
jgi:hypothetical protein